MAEHPKSNGRFGDPVFISKVEEKFGHLDLAWQAMKCMTWLSESPKGRKRVRIATTWENWLENAEKDRTGRWAQRPRRASPSATAEDFEKVKWWQPKGTRSETTSWPSTSRVLQRQLGSLA